MKLVAGSFTVSLSGLRPFVDFGTTTNSYTDQNQKSPVKMLNVPLPTVPSRLWFLNDFLQKPMWVTHHDHHGRLVSRNTSSLTT